MKFFETPPADETRRPLPVARPKAEQPFNTILLAEKWVGVFTHWWGGKTVLCESDDCPACQRNIARIWKGFIPVCDGHHRDKHALLQFTGRCVVTLDGHESLESGLLGARVLWHRKGKRQNSPLGCEFMGWAAVKDRYSMERVQEIVSRIFKNTGHFQKPD